MRIGGVVAEFNPFHNGHEALVKAAKASGVDYVIAVMGGNFVQRGEAAIADKHLRTRCALAGGVDLVIELPLPYAASTAERFANGAVTLLAACGVVDTLLFGSESGDHQVLQRLAETVDSPGVRREIGGFLAEGMTFAKARQLAVEKTAGPELSAMLATPNNALAVEYLRAAKRVAWRNPDSARGYKSDGAPENPTHELAVDTVDRESGDDLAIFTIPRLQVAHDAAQPRGNVASASYLRRYAADMRKLSKYVPPASLRFLEQALADGLYPAAPSKLEIAILSHLRRLDRETLAGLPDLSEGLENRLYGAIRAATSLEELYGMIKTKRYTFARVRRLVSAAFLGITADDQHTPPAYIHVLGYRQSAKGLMNLVGRSASLPVGTSLVQLSRTSAAAAKQAALEASAGDLYSLILPNPRACGHEFRAKVEVL